MRTDRNGPFLMHWDIADDSAKKGDHAFNFSYSFRASSISMLTSKTASSVPPVASYRRCNFSRNTAIRCSKAPNS